MDLYVYKQVTFVEQWFWLTAAVSGQSAAVSSLSVNLLNGTPFTITYNLICTELIKWPPPVSNGLSISGISFWYVCIIYSSHITNSSKDESHVGYYFWK